MNNGSSPLFDQFVALNGTLSELGDGGALFEAFPDAVLVLDAHRTRAIAANLDFITLVGRDVKQLHDPNFHPLEVIHSDDHALFHSVEELGTRGGNHLRIVQLDGSVVPVEVCASLVAGEHWIYCFRMIESRKILEQRLEEQIKVQKQRTVEAVRASLRIYQLTEKIRSAPKLSALLLDVNTEEELFQRAGEFLVSEGFNYREVAFFALDEDQLSLRYCSGSRSQQRYDINKESRYAVFLRDGKQPDNPDEQLVTLRCKDQVLGLLEVRFDPRERAFFKENSLIEEWHDDIIETIAEILALFIENIRLYNRLRLQTVLDPLTGVYNRHYLLSQLEEEVKRSRRYGRPFSLVFIDVDSFKGVNDTYGHLQGDAVLVDITRELRQQLRNCDCICRYGGDEFVVILPETDVISAEEKAKKLVSAIERYQFALVNATEKKSHLTLSISAGVAAAADHLSAEEILHGADSALYGAKRRGKNRVFRVTEFDALAES